MSRPARPSRPECLTACLLTGLGGLLMLFAAGRTWASATITQPPLPPRRLAVTGGDLAASARALGLVALAGVAALVALHGRARVLGGLVLSAAGLAAALAFGASSADGVRRADEVAAQRDTGAAVTVSGRTGWPYGYLAGGLAVFAAGSLTIARSRRWPHLGSRYEAAATRPGSADPWSALDRGEDPTQR